MHSEHRRLEDTVHHARPQLYFYLAPGIWRRAAKKDLPPLLRTPYLSYSYSLELDELRFQIRLRFRFSVLDYSSPSR